MVLGAANSVDVTTLIGFTRFLTDTLDNVSAYPDASIIANLNIEGRELQTFILSEVCADWKENTLEGTGAGLINLTASDNSYPFPTGLVTVDRIEVNYTGAVNGWVKAMIRKQESLDVALSNTSNDAAVYGSKANPIVYIRNGTLYLDPIPDQTVTGGLKVYCTTLMTDLAAASPTGEPIFVTAFHPILAYGAAERYMKQKEYWSKANATQADKLTRMSAMVAHYSTRESSTRIGLRPMRRSFR